MSQQPPGTVGVLFDSESSSHARFTFDLYNLELPAGSKIDFETGSDENAMRNRLVERAIERDSYWIWFINERHTFKPQTVIDLLSREQAIVAPIVIDFKSPFSVLSATTWSRVPGKAVPLSLDPVVGPGSLIEIVWASPSGLLIRRAVLDAAGSNWFDDEVDICSKALAHGIQPYVDTSVRLGNRIISTIEPVYRAGRWELSVSAEEMEFSVQIKS